MNGTHFAPSPLPGARNNTLFYYSDRGLFPPICQLLNDKNVNESAMSPLSRTVCKVSALFLCRISEVLALRVSNVFSPDRVVCPGSKRGSGYLIFLPGLSLQLKEAGQIHESVPLFPISYIQCYRNFLRANISLVRKGRSSRARTHAGRYQINRLSEKGFEMNTLGELLHHKSRSSILYYLQS